MVLWVNMISDALPSFALGYDVPEADLMNQPPRNVKQSILHGMLGRIFLRRYCDGWARVCRLHLGCQSRHERRRSANLAF